MANDNVDVGNQTPTRKPGQPIAERLAQSDGSPEPRIDKPLICGAMSLQRGDSGRESVAQKFVHLVGCRDPKVRPEPWVRPHPIATKQ